MTRPMKWSKEESRLPYSNLQALELMPVAHKTIPRGSKNGETLTWKLRRIEYSSRPHRIR